MKNASTYKNIFFSLLKILTGAVAVYYLWTQKNLPEIFSGIRISWDVWTVILLLSLLNWYWEIKKWQYLVSRVQKIDFWQAAYQSLTGFAVSMLTPNRIGEYGAKVLFFPPALRKKIFSLSLIGNMSQLGATLVFGLWGIFWVWYKKLLDFEQLPGFPAHNWFWLILLILLLFVLYKKYLHNRALLLTDLQIWRGSFKYAVLRYMAFATEFYWLFTTLNTDVNHSELVFAAIFIMYFLSTFVPMPAFLDWAVKGTLAVWIFGKLGLDETLALKVTALMWFLNFFLAFVAGIIIYLINTHKPKKP